MAVDKFAIFCEESIDNSHVKSIVRCGNLLCRVELSSLDEQLPRHRGKAGFFFEYSLKSREEFFAVVSAKYQTVTQFGIDVATLRDEVVAAHLRGIDRIVPFGKAMDVGIVWDGYDLIRTLSRVVMI